MWAFDPARTSLAEEMRGMMMQADEEVAKRKQLVEMIAKAWNQGGSRRQASQDSDIGTENDDSKVSILIWNKIEGGDGKLGHTAIRIGSITYGYYTRNSVYGSPGSMHVDDEEEFKSTYPNEWVTEFELNVSQKQVQDLKKAIQETIDDPGRYSVFGSQCSSVAFGWLTKAGVYFNSYTSKAKPIANPVTFARHMTPDSFENLLKQTINKHIVKRYHTYQIKNE